MSACNRTTALFAILLAACASPVAPGGDRDAAQPVDDAAQPADAVPMVPPDVDGRLAINEFMAKSRMTLVDGAVTTSDWIELYNPTDHDISLEGYGVTDNLSRPHKHLLGAGVVVPAGGYLLLWPDGDLAGGPTHLGFRLARKGEAIGLSRPDGSYIDRISYAEQAVDFSAARVPDGSDTWQIQWHPTPGAANPAGDGQPRGPNDPTAPPAQVPAAGDVTERLLGYDVLPELEFILTAEAMAALDADPRTYVPAKVVFDGRTFGPVGFRLKGNNSFRPLSGKAALRIKINEYVRGARLSGLRNLTLNNMNQDMSMMHERVGYWVARELGIAASRSNHAFVTINGETYGLYAQIETVKRELLARWFDDRTGPLHANSGKAGDLVPGDIPKFSLKSGPDDRSLLLGLADALTITDPDAAIEAARTYLDVTQFQRFWAMCALIGQFNSTPYSAPGDDTFFYADPTTGRLAVMPWGFDSTFYSAAYDVTGVYSVLARKCLDSPACAQGFVDQTWELLDAVEAMDWEGERARVAAQIAPYIELDTRKEYTSATVAEFHMQMYWFIKGRRYWLGEMLPPHSGSL